GGTAPPAGERGRAGGEDGPARAAGAGNLFRRDPGGPAPPPPASWADLRDDAPGAPPPVRLVIGVDAELDIGPEHLAPLSVLGETVEAGQRVRRDRRPEPLDRVAVVVVMRRLDQDEMQ